MPAIAELQDTCLEKPAAESRQWHKRPNSPVRQNWRHPDRSNVLGKLLQMKLDAFVLVSPKTLDERFIELADEWSAATRHISSTTELVNHPAYRKIVNLGMDVVPYLLRDLRDNKRFWFPALTEITKIRPYDPGDTSNPRLMLEAWIRWGQRKNYI